ncbi:hypothetical protein AYI70_g5546 [Smittium culicis]|uniref:RNA-directed DNA polymerase from mobile element jockey n=1 Tax=Smittium culicis TaxID=133412 RepID=A0A1R1XU04_9FUNG|nr:hypothetical protein AYI70_g5546 [Smittium culicis]
MAETNNMKIAYWNCQGLSERKWDKVLSVFDNIELDILFLAETWFIDDDVHHSHPYYLISTRRIDPKTKFGHESAGMVCLVSPNIRRSITSVSISAYTINIKINEHDITAVYFPPSMKIDEILRIKKDFEFQF